MSASQAAILDFLNVRLGTMRGIGVGLGLDVRHADQFIGMARNDRAAASDAPQTVEVAAVTTHTWAARIGKYNDEPIWGEIFANIRDSRRRIAAE